MPALARFVAEALHGRDRPVIDQPGASLDAWEILERSERIRIGLCGSGIGPNEPIVLRVANRGADIAAFLGVWRAGGVVVPIHAAVPAAVLDRVNAAAGVRLHLDGATGTVSTVASEPPPERSLLEGAALIVFTSGSTGPPKGVVLGHDRLAAKLGVLHGLLRPTSETRLLLPLQITFIFGIWLALLTIGAGGRLTMMPKFSPAGVGEAFATGVTTAAFVPTMLRALLAGPCGIAPAPGLRQLLTGGETLDEALGSRIADALPQAGVFDLYGLTETGSCDFCLSPQDQRAGAGSIGMPTPGVTYRIMAEDGSEVQGEGLDGAAGELQIRTPFGMLGYLDRSDLTAASFTDGWFRTGDLARRRTDGFVELVGRSKEIISRGGNKIAPLEIDRLFAAHPDVAAALTTGLPDPLLGESLHVMIVPRPGARLDADALRIWAADRIEKFKLPDMVHFAPELPPGPTGKADRRALRQQIQGVGQPRKQSISST
jgi:acyl-CoA synthetase (AMP-forming)/AMP-acid ligase II